MELEDLKNRWSSLEDKLKEQEILNEKLIQEIRQTKSGPLGVLIKYAYFGIAVCILAIFILMYVYTHSIFFLFKSLIFLSCGIFLIVWIIVGIYNILHLMKIDFTKNVTENIWLIQTYKINYKKQSIYSIIVVTVIFSAVIVACLLSPNMEAWRWIVLSIAIPLTGFLGYLEYKKIIKAKTEAILKSLDELKELEED